MDITKKTKIAYIHTAKYPSAMANAIQAIKTASALSNITKTTIFVPGVATSEASLKEVYAISETPLRIQSMQMDKWRLLTLTLSARVKNFYAKSLSFYLQNHPAWSGFQGEKVLFVRARTELIYWGLQREKSKWLKNWTFIFEAHDALGFDAAECDGANPFDVKDGAEGKYRQTLLKALLNYDRVISLSQALADDIVVWTNHAIQPQVIGQASSVPRLPQPPKVQLGEEIVIGYIGTIDQLRGVNTLLEAVKYLPQNYKLRLVGKVRHEEGVDTNWLDSYLNDPLIKSRIEYFPPVPLKDVANEIDQCDILVQPGTRNSEYDRYASPLKAFDPMMRGKPIVAADTPGMRALYEDGKYAHFYQIEPRSLAESIVSLAGNPEQAQKLAQAGWEKSIDYTYRHRAEKILSLVQQ
jgi:glycosyltransferase involved in cell wall biosynthesis